MSKEFPIQTQWHEKVKELRPADPTHRLSSNELDAPACKWLAAELRKLADHIESGKYPQVFGCAIPKNGIDTKDLMLDFSVVLSHPWPG